MGKVDEERLAIKQKNPCLYDKAVSAFHNKNVSSLSTLSGITNKTRAHISFFLNESAAIMSISFDFGTMIIFLFGLIFRS